MSQRSTSVKSPVLPLPPLLPPCGCSGRVVVVAAVGLAVGMGAGSKGSSSEGAAGGTGVVVTGLGAGSLGTGRGSSPMMESSLPPLMLSETGAGAGLRGSSGRESVEGAVGIGVPDDRVQGPQSTHQPDWAANTLNT